MIKEFRDFINRGNLVDIAVGFVIGVAFATVISAFTDRIVNPLIGLVFSLDSLDQMGTFGENGSVGAFLGAVINFLITAFALFLVVKAYNRFRAEAPPAEPSEEVLLLREIRDSLQTS